MVTVRILIAGGDGQLGREFADISDPLVELIRCTRTELDITDPASIEAALDLHRPQAIINAAAYTSVDRAETDTAQAFSINASGPGLLAQAAERRGIVLLHVSTDYVFSGDKPIGDTWSEQDACEPRSVYGSSKLAGEKQVLELCSKALVLRTSWVFGRYGNNFPKTMLRLARERDELRVVGDQWGCPTHAGDIASTLVKATQAMLAGRLPSGTYHYAGTPACTWYELASFVVESAFAVGLLSHKPRIVAIGTSEYPVAAARPVNSALCCDQLCSLLGLVLPDWKPAVLSLCQYEQRSPLLPKDPC